MGTVLTAEQLKQPRLKTEWVPLPAWGDGAGVYVRALKGSERDAFEARQVDASETERLQNFRARFVVLTACDADGKRLFADVDVAAVGEQDHETLDEIFDAARKLNRMLLSKTEEEELQKKTDRNGDSGSS